jgi:rubrerythrin
MGQMWNSVDEVLDYAIVEERQAVFMYRAFASRAATQELKQLFEGFVGEEKAHFEKLLKMRKASDVTVETGSLSRLPKPKKVTVPADGLVDATAAYRFAIRAEKSAWELYWVFAQMTKEPEIRKTFELLAGEELEHRERLKGALEARQSPKGIFRGLIRLFRKK